MKKKKHYPKGAWPKCPDCGTNMVVGTNTYCPKCRPPTLGISVKDGVGTKDEVK